MALLYVPAGSPHPSGEALSHRTCWRLDPVSCAALHCWLPAEPAWRTMLGTVAFLGSLLYSRRLGICFACLARGDVMMFVVTCMAVACAFPPSVTSVLYFHPNYVGEVADHTLRNLNTL